MKIRIIRFAFILLIYYQPCLADSSYCNISLNRCIEDCDLQDDLDSYTDYKLCKLSCHDNAELCYHSDDFNQDNLTNELLI